MHALINRGFQPKFEWSHRQSKQLFHLIEQSEKEFGKVQWKKVVGSMGLDFNLCMSRFKEGNWTEEEVQKLTACY